MGCVVLGMLGQRRRCGIVFARSWRGSLMVVHVISATRGGWVRRARRLRGCFSVCKFCLCLVRVVCYSCVCDVGVAGLVRRHMQLCVLYLVT